MKADDALARSKTSSNTTQNIRLSNVQRHLDRDLVAIAPGGHYIALRMGFGIPVEEINHLPDSWVKEYTRNGYAPFDPLIRWVHTHIGTIRWSVVEQSERSSILVRARAHGMNFGAVVSLRVPDCGPQRSFGIFARPDREFLDDELKEVFKCVESLHFATLPPGTLTECEAEALGFVRNGKRLKEIAWQIGITEGAVKQRLKSARTKLGAKTSAESVAVATRFRLL